MNPRAVAKAVVEGIGARVAGFGATVPRSQLILDVLFIFSNDVDSNSGVVIGKDKLAAVKDVRVAA